MNPAKAFAGGIGAVYLLVGLVGFTVTGGSQETHQLFWLFDVNLVHNIVHLAVGALGLAAFSAGVQASRTFAIGLAVVYAAVAVAGLTQSGQFLGIIPLAGYDIALHIGTALVAVAAFALSSSRQTARA